jgi:hypothetical protein
MKYLVIELDLNVEIINWYKNVKKIMNYGDDKINICIVEAANIQEAFDKWFDSFKDGNYGNYDNEDMLLEDYTFEHNWDNNDKWTDGPNKILIFECTNKKEFDMQKVYKRWRKRSNILQEKIKQEAEYNEYLKLKEKFDK